MLREFLVSHRVEIIERTRAKVSARIAPLPTALELDAGIPAFLDQLIAVLGPDGPSGAIAARATRHGGDLFEQGFTVAQVVHDYGGVCQSVTELAVELDAAIAPDEFRTFNGCLDDAIAEAVTEYTRRLEVAVTNVGVERLGVLAHELRNALSGAIMAFDILSKGGVGTGGSTAGVLGRSLKRLSQLVDSSLVAVRLEAGVVSNKPVSVRQLIEQAEAEAAMDATARGMALIVPAVAPELQVSVDAQLLAAAIANLLQNAFKFNRPAGRVTLRTSAVGGRALIEVEDECGGLPAGAIDRLFHPFDQGGADRTGLGLGLAISRRSVEASGGQLRVVDLPGKGCIFTIDLPSSEQNP